MHRLLLLIVRMQVAIWRELLLEGKRSVGARDLCARQLFVTLLSEH